MNDTTALSRQDLDRLIDLVGAWLLCGTAAAFVIASDALRHGAIDALGDAIIFLMLAAFSLWRNRSVKNGRR